MPMAPLRFCAGRPHCTNRVIRGLCPTCRPLYAKRQSGGHGAGYTKAWTRFRERTFPGMLTERGIPTACGARLAPGPSPRSQCAADGVVNMTDLHLHHEPPLTEDERKDPAVVMDETRCEFLCRSCHARETGRARRPWGAVAKYFPSISG